MKKIFTSILCLGMISALLLSAVGCGNKEPIDNTGDQGGYEQPVEGEQPNENYTPEQGGNEPDIDEPVNPVDPTPQQPNTGNSGTEGNEDPDIGSQGKEETGNKTDNDEPQKEDPKDDDPKEEEPVVKSPYPWDNGGKAPSRYTWDEFLALSTEYKEAFIMSFKNTEAYMAWLEKANDDIQPKSDLPWENGGKQPVQYTWAEFLALTDEQKAAFVASFAQPTDYQNWLAGATGQSGSTTDPTPSNPTIPSTPTVTPTEKMPWEKPGAKRPAEYTWAEYNALTSAQKAAFFKTFSNQSDFQVWMDNALGINNSGSGSGSSSGVIPPWTTGGKQPVQYTWEEYEALTAELKIAFRNSFKTQAEYDDWYQMVQGSGPVMPWEDGGKLPNQYTWAEYEALTDEYQEYFYEWFETNDAFMAWMNSVKGTGNTPEQPSTPELPWKNGGKQPDQYTWAEFQALTDELKEYFQDWFGSSDAFMTWMNSVKPNEGGGNTNTPNLPWKNGGKQPDQYTFAEFQSLSDELKEYFQDWFIENNLDFMAWMNSVNGSGNNTPVIPWKNGGKRPDQYTFAEFQALSDELKEYFQDWFIENNLDFMAWMNSVNGSGNNTPVIPWENGGKLPNQYTWAEFLALDDVLQEYFQDWFDDFEAFEAWMNAAQS